MCTREDLPKFIFEINTQHIRFLLLMLNSENMGPSSLQNRIVKEECDTYWLGGVNIVHVRLKAWKTLNTTQCCLRQPVCFFIALQELSVPDIFCPALTGALRGAGPSVLRGRSNLGVNFRLEAVLLISLFTQLVVLPALQKHSTRCCLSKVKARLKSRTIVFLKLPL